MIGSLIYRRIVRPDGLVSVNGQFFQVPAELADQTIDIDVATLKYFRVPRTSKIWKRINHIRTKALAR